jgi:hypothetical protein
VVDVGDDGDVADVRAVTYDGYHGRENTSQPFEQLVFQFLDAGGTVLATSAPTTDLADLVLEATAVTVLPTLGWTTGTATQVRALHAYLGTDATPNSLEPMCLSVDPVPTPQSTTTTTTTTTTIQPGDTTTTTTAPTEVLPEVVVPPTPVPRPQVVSPTYTG